jgi:hypothetical protein
MSKKTMPDWEAIERTYRAGLLSVREIGAAHGISHTAINKRAKTFQWARDLKERVRAKAEDLVSKSEVSRLVSTETAKLEDLEVRANATVMADTKIQQRKSIRRARAMVDKMLDELDTLTDEQGSIKDLIMRLKESDHDDSDAMSDMLALANKIGALPSRSKTMKELAETLRILVALERQAYGIDESPYEECYEDRLARVFAGNAQV